MTPDDFYPPENYYRVSIKPLIYDEQGRLLVGQDVDGLWAMLGGGWQHGETWQDCIRREVREEIGVEVTSIDQTLVFYRHTTPEGHPKISIAVPVKVSSHDFAFNPEDEEIVAVKFVTKQEFLALPFMESEASVKQCADQIWSAVEKNAKNR